MNKMDLKAIKNNQTNTRKTMKPYLTIFLFLTIAFIPIANAQIPGTQNFWAETAAATIPEGMTITNADQNKMVVSIYDTDYDPAPNPLPAATLATFGDGGTDTAIDIQGVIGTLNSGDELTVTLNYTATGAVDYPAYSETVSVPSELIEGGGGPIDLTLSYDAGTTVVGDGTITATIVAASTLNVKKLDLYGAGFNDPTPGYPLAAFSISTDNSGGEGTVRVRIMTGIPDRAYGDGAHDFLYAPVVAEDGNTWLNLNLGADYGHVNHPSFNPSQKATSLDDYLAYGSMYQWGRYSDGHELITWTSATEGTIVNGTTPNKTNVPTHGNFITPEQISPFDWRSNPSSTLWANESSTNNPCPRGYRVPRETELSTLFTAANIANSEDAVNSNLAFPTAGFRLYTDGLVSSNSPTWLGYYSSSTVNDVYVRVQRFASNSASSIASNVRRADAFAVRCIKN